MIFVACYNVGDIENLISWWLEVGSFRILRMHSKEALHIQNHSKTIMQCEEDKICTFIWPIVDYCLENCNKISVFIWPIVDYCLETCNKISVLIWPIVDYCLENCNDFILNEDVYLLWKIRDLSRISKIEMSIYGHIILQMISAKVLSK